MPLPLIRLAALALSVSTLAGCGYYGQSIRGQWEVISQRHPIERLLADPQTPEDLRQRLRLAQRMRDFASRELALPDNGSYRSYADLGRPYVVWNVFAARPLELRLKTWCFPVAGCVGYRGYFSEQAARTFAAGLRAQGLETWVTGIRAYSTLGWFDDPLLNTVIDLPAARLAGLMFHELAHQRLYVKGDTAFNEAFASTVEEEGVRRWLARFGDRRQRRDDALFRQRRDAFVNLVTAARDRLAALYAEAIPEAEKRRRKAVLIEALRADYAALRREWNGYAGYDAWFEGPLNNPQLAAVTTYRDGVPAFQRLLAEAGGDLAAFYDRAEAMGEWPAQRRRAWLDGQSPGS